MNIKSNYFFRKIFQLQNNKAKLLRSNFVKQKAKLNNHKNVLLHKVCKSQGQKLK